MSNTWIGFNEQPKYRVIACKFCHRTSGEKGVTLIKGEDSYYCQSCYNALMLKKRMEERKK